MNTAHKGILISSIINYLRTNVESKNRELVAQNLHSEQESFDEGDMFFQLAFMTDDEINKIAKPILV